MPLILFMELPAYFFHYLTIKQMFPIKNSRPARFILFFAGILLVCMIIYFGDLDNLPPTFFLYLLGVQYACEGSFGKKLTLSLMISSTVFAWNALLDNVLSFLDFSYIVLLRVFFSLLLYLLIRFRGPDAETELSASLWHLMLFLTFLPLGIVLSIVLLTPQTYTSAWLLRLYAVLLVLALLFFLALLWTIAVLSRQQELEKQNLYAETNRAYYESLQRQHFEVRRLKHDLSNHLRTLSLLPEGEKERYIVNLLESPGLTQRTDYCKDMTVNAVLSIKEAAMRENGIHPVWKLDIPEELPFEKAEVCVLFANALDNAIEGCLAFPEEKRFIELTSRCRKGIFVMSVKNPTTLTFDARRPSSPKSPGIPPTIKKGKPSKDSPSKSSKHLPSSTKSDAKRHGFGLRSMDSIVQHHQGSLELSADGTVFELFLYLPA